MAAPNPLAVLRLAIVHSGAGGLVCVLSGRPGLLFRRNSVSGALEALPRDGDWGALNAARHAH